MKPDLVDHAAKIREAAGLLMGTAKVLNFHNRHKP
jgi:hypothetical protein